MKVIFLDFDGVLNSNDWFTKANKDGTLDRDNPVDPSAVKKLNKIIEKTAAKIVVSSTWRILNTKEGLQKILDNLGFIGEIIDLTPRIHFKEIYESVPRGCEIDYWLNRTGKFQRINWDKEIQRGYLEKSTVKNYVILDDDSDMLYNQREHFIKTNNKVGLTNKDANQAIKILNSSIIDLYYE